MLVLSKGWKLPETGDFGDVWFLALEHNAILSNSHNHDGVNSEKITTLALISIVSTVLAGSFTDQGNGYFRALILTPSGTLLDTLAVTIKDPISKDPIYLKMEKVSPTSFYIFTNFVQNVEVYFGV